jgi:hypothetical protein
MSSSAIASRIGVSRWYAGASARATARIRGTGWRWRNWWEHREQLTLNLRLRHCT